MITSLRHTVLAAAAVMAMTFPSHTFAQDEYAPADGSAPDGILVFGGTRGTGLEVIKILAGRGDAVTAFVRPTSDVAELQSLGVELFEGDALEADSVQAAFESGSYRAVISSLGSSGGDSPVDDVGTINIATAAAASGVNRMLMVSSIGAGESLQALPFFVRWVLGSALERKTTAENYIKASTLDYTIIRPGGLGDGPATGTGFLVEDTQRFDWGRIPRAEVARLLVMAFDDPTSLRKVYHAVPD